MTIEVTQINQSYLIPVKLKIKTPNGGIQEVDNLKLGFYRAIGLVV